MSSVRLVQVAKILGMSGQELRKELTDVNLGVKPTDREVPENLASGVIRFIANKHKLDIDLDNIPALLGTGGESVDDQPDTAPVADDQQTVEQNEEEKQEEEKDEEEKEQPSQLKVLRKLSLEGVSKEAIAKQKKKLSKAPSAKPSHSTRRSRPPKPKKEAHVHQAQIKKKEGTVFLPDQITVKEFSEKTGIQTPKVVQALMKNGVMATINQQIDFDTASIIASELGVDVQKQQGAVSVEALIKQDLAELLKDEPENLTVRPPIVTVMGHVDHGKTAILDAIRSANVVAKEAGGITQHIGAYQVEHDGKNITFLDTPGHEAFTAMRARGAQVTDIAILVVAADEGIKPTTIEAIDHAKDAGVPIIVAINKIDKETADIERVKGELAGHGLQPEDWGGDTPVVPCSAVTKKGIDDLLDSILIVAEVNEYKANPNRNAVATIIESNLDSAHGPVTTIIVNTGTLKIGDAIACGAASGKVKVLMDAHGKRLTQVSPSGPARLAGLDALPQVGDILQVFSSDREARTFAETYRETKAREKKRGLADLVSRLSEGKMTQLKIVLKADAQGSLESLEASLAKLESEGVQPKVIHAAIGAITESDVMMAAASDGIVLGFSVDASSAVYKTAEREGVEIKSYDIIYKLLEDVQLLLVGLIEPEEEERITGHIQIRGAFFQKKNEQIVGGKVTDGAVKRTPFRILRDGEKVGTGRITSLKHVEKDIKEAKEGSECGMRVESDITIAVDDILEVYVKEFKKAS